MTSFAANRLEFRDGKTVTIRGAGNKFGMVGVTEQAAWGDRSPKMRIVFLVPRRQIPDPFQGIPGDRGCEEVTVAIDQVGPPITTGTDHGIHIHGGLRDSLPRTVVHAFSVSDPILLLFDPIGEWTGLEWVVCMQIVPFERSRVR